MLGWPVINPMSPNAWWVTTPGVINPGKKPTIVAL
jgi:hypothetical protein